MQNEQSKAWQRDRKRRDALVLGLIDQAVNEAPTDADAASALIRSAATILSRNVGEEAACDLLLAALVDVRMQLHRRNAH